MKIIFDLDGTLALCEHRAHYIDKARPGGANWKDYFAACEYDAPNWPIVSILNAMLDHGNYVEIWSGRSDEVRLETIDWLHNHLVRGRTWIASHLRMREAGDFTPDHELKERWLRFENPKPDLVFDDRQQVVDMWRRNGITCCQVAPGNF